MEKKLKLIVPKEEFIKLLQERLKKGNEIQRYMETNPEAVSKHRVDVLQWRDVANDILSESFNVSQNKYASSFITNDDYNLNLGVFASEMNFRSYLWEKMQRIEGLIERAQLIREETVQPVVTRKELSITDNKKIFIVHGHNEVVKEKVARTLSSLGLKPIILHEQSNAGQTIIEKFETHSEVGYAIVLLTGDDLGKNPNAPNLNKRARQNVIFEFGFFIGRLSRKNVFILYSEDVELPSDVQGMLYCPLDHEDAWRYKMAKELKEAGYPIDLNNLH